MSIWRMKNGRRVCIEDDDEREETIIDALMEWYSLSSLPTIKTTKKEYGLIHSSINNDKYHINRDKKYIITVVENGYAYIVENHGYNEHRVIAKRKIKWQKEKNYIKN